MDIEQPTEVNVSATTDPPVEIHEVRALRVDVNGRVARLRVIGVVDRLEQFTKVDVCVAELNYFAGWEDQGASAYARIVNREPKPEGKRREAHTWLAEVDVLLPVAVPPIMIGRQTVPVNVRARMFVDEDQLGEAREQCIEIKSAVEFDAGVLFVHGIGKQRRSETLSQWSAPLARWINAWLKGGADDIARKLSGMPMKPDKQSEPSKEAASVRGWWQTLVCREHYDPDFVDRVTYASALTQKVESRAANARAAGDWRPEARAAAVKRAKEFQQKPTKQEEEDYKKVKAAIDAIGANAVGGTAEFREAYVLDVGAHAFEPSSVELHIEAMAANGDMQRTRWLVAESFWAETFWAPSFFSFGRWCLLTAPVVLVHYIALARLRHRYLWWLKAVGLTIGLTAAQLAFLLLMVLWLVPWERIRRAVLKVQLALAGIIGDAFVLLQDPVQRRAILDRVQRDLNWLLQRCRKVVVVAHSQGAAVAEIVLSNRDDNGDGNIHSFVTLGSGVQTLTAIEEKSRLFGVNLAGWLAIASAISVGTAIGMFFLGRWNIAAGLLVLSIIAFWFAASRVRKEPVGRLSSLPRAGAPREWFDFFSTKDLVPYGPLLDPRNTDDQYKPKEVRNRDSLLGDHVLYWQNPEQVVGPVAREIGAAADFKPLKELLPNDVAALERLERARLSRLDRLRIGRGVALLGSAILLYKLWPALVAIFFWALVWLQSKVGFVPGALPAPGLRTWLQALLVLVPFIVYKTLMNAMFDAWTIGEVERLLRRSDAYPATHSAYFFAVLVMLTLVVPIIYVLQIGTWPVVGGTALGVFVLAFFAASRHYDRVDPKRVGAGATSAAPPRP